MKINLETKFNIGDLVYIRAEKLNERGDAYSRAYKNIIIQILVEYCTAGPQIHYRLRRYTNVDSIKIVSTEVFITLNEIELEVVATATE